MDERNEVMETMDLELMEGCDVELVEAGSSRRIGGKIVGGLLLAAIVGTGVAMVKNRGKIKDKINARRIARLEKAGYGVISPEDMVELEDYEESDVVEADTEE